MGAGPGGGAGRGPAAVAGAVLVGNPGLVVVVTGTATDVGKTWVSCGLARLLAARGERVSARKPAQSFAPGTPAEGTDAALLAAATGEDIYAVCPPHRWYARAMAPPMAAASLGLPGPTLSELVAETESSWPAGAATALVELAGGVGSPMAADGDGAAFVARLQPGLVVVVAPSGLGALHEVRLSVRALPAGARSLVVLNRYDPGDELHWRNRRWLEEQDGLEVLTGVEALAEAVLAASLGSS